jgi:VCBS repeat-containing protein
VQALKAGELVTDSLVVSSVDGSASATLTVSITGTNDVATLGGTLSGAVQEDVTLTAGGTITVTDADAGQSGIQPPATLKGTYGTYAIDATTGIWSYALNNAAANVQALKGGQVVTDTVQLRSIDGGTSQALTVTITGTNDPATITGTATGAVKEDGTLTAGGALKVTDVDTGEAGFRVPASLAGTYGAFTFNTTSGAWTYALNNTAAAVQSLKGGQVVTDTLTVTSLDGSASKAISVAVTGVNDPASIAGTIGVNRSEASSRSALAARAVGPPHGIMLIRPVVVITRQHSRRRLIPRQSYNGSKAAVVMT